MDRRSLLAAPLLALGRSTLGSVPSALRIGLIGQSNMVGYGPLSLSVPWQKVGDRFNTPPTCVYPDGTRSILNDPTHGGAHLYPVTASGFYGVGYVGAMVRQLLLGGIEAVEVVACAKGGSAVGSWTYQATTLSTNYLFGAAKALCDLAGPIGLFYFHQGEQDAAVGTSQAVYQSREAQLAGYCQTYLGAPMMTCLLQACYASSCPYQDQINAAKMDNWASGATLQGPDFRDISTMPEDTVHLALASKLELAGARAGQSILTWAQSP